MEAGMLLAKWVKVLVYDPGPAVYDVYACMGQVRKMHCLQHMVFWSAVWVLRGPACEQLFMDRFIEHGKGCFIPH